MDVRDVLREEHQQLQELATAVVEADDPAQAKRIFHQLKEALVRHSRAEERVVYNALMDCKEPEAIELAEEGEIEHEIADRLLQQNTRGRADSPGWKARMKVLRDMLEHHVRDEESHVFDALERHFSLRELQKMGERFEEHKERVQLVTPRGRGSAESLNQ